MAHNENTDGSSMGQCAVFIKCMNCRLNIIEEFLNLILIEGTTTERDIFQSLKSCIEKHGLLWNRLVCLANDGAWAMSSRNLGIVGLVKNWLKSLEIDGINFFDLHCIMHQETLCSKSLKMKKVMDYHLK